MSVNSEKAIVFREKWGTLTIMAMAGCVCLIYPMLFYLQISAAQSGQSHSLLFIFCTVFALAGAVILIRLPRHARQYFQDSGAHVAVADLNGITLTSIPGTEPKHWPWSSIAEVTLANRLRIIDDEGTIFCSHSMVFFFPSEINESWSWLNKLKYGISKSGQGRFYLTCKYPQGTGLDVESAFRQFAPNSVRVKLHQKVVFDCRLGVDFYSEVSMHELVT